MMYKSISMHLRPMHKDQGMKGDYRGDVSILEIAPL